MENLRLLLLANQQLFVVVGDLSPSALLEIYQLLAIRQQHITFGGGGPAVPVVCKPAFAGYPLSSMKSLLLTWLSITVQRQV